MQWATGILELKVSILYEIQEYKKKIEKLVKWMRYNPHEELGLQD